MDGFLDWVCSYYRLYDEWHETKKKTIYIRVEWSAGWLLMFGIDFSSPHTYRLRVFGFDIMFHWLRKGKKYWGKKIIKKD